MEISDGNYVLPSFPVHEAVATGNLNYVKQVLAFGGDVNDLHFGGITPLHMACLAGHYEIALYLIENGAEVDAFSLERSTPLCDAAAGGHPAIVRLLLARGARVNPPLLLCTPLHEAAIRGNIKGCAEVVEALLTAGADVRCNDSHHGTPLHAACSKKHPCVLSVRLLLEAGSNPSALQYHRTPLHLIAENSRCTDSAALLLYYGADLHHRDTRNRRPQDLCPASSALHALLVAWQRDPQPLLLLCRLAIRRAVGGEKLRGAGLDNMGLPVGVRRILR